MSTTEPDDHLETIGVRELRRSLVIGATLVALPLGSAIAAPFRRRAPGEAAADGMVRAFERLGPTFVKVGQLIASAPGLFPETLSTSCRRCLDDTAPVPAVVIRAALERELGRPVSEVFAEFDDDCLASASIAQVHACVLPDGRPAVVKVKRPGIDRGMRTDLRILHGGARLLARLDRFKGFNPVGVVDDLRRVTIEELDLASEGRRMELFLDRVHQFGDNREITAPELYREWSSGEVLCMERMWGRPIDRFAEDPTPDVDGALLLRTAIKAWFEAALTHGTFHGDVHGGNLWVLDDGRVCLLDFGITGRLEPIWQEFLRSLLFAVIEDDPAAFASMAKVFKTVGAMPEDAGTDEEVGDRLRLLLTPMLTGPLGEIGIGELFTSLLDAMKDFGMVLPTELVLVAKQVVYFERYAKELAPEWHMGRDPHLLTNLGGGVPR